MGDISIGWLGIQEALSEKITHSAKHARIPVGSAGKEEEGTGTKNYCVSTSAGGKEKTILFPWKKENIYRCELWSSVLEMF